MENKLAVVTGASRGIGKSIAIKLAKDGFYVVGTATSEQGANAIGEYFNKNSVNGIGIKLNVNNLEAIDNFKNEVNKIGNIEVLVNNAGITQDNLLMRMSEDEWSNVINTNLHSVFRLTKTFLRNFMKNKRGSIINIASVVGVVGNAGQTNYAASKAGIIGFTKSLAREVGMRGIRINTIAPGFIDTDMTKKLPEEQREFLIKQIPLQKLGQPEDIANLVIFLASDKSAYITGQTISVNGGMYMSS